MARNTPPRLVFIVSLPAVSRCEAGHGATAPCPAPQGRKKGATYCGIPGICIFCGSPLIWEVSLVRTFFSTIVVSGPLIFTMA